MKVLNKFLIVQRVLDNTENKSGFIMTMEDKRELRYSKAIVVSVGGLVSGITDTDEIYFDKAAGHDVLIDEKRLTVIQEKDVVCVL